MSRKLTNDLSKASFCCYKSIVPLLSRIIQWSGYRGTLFEWTYQVFRLVLEVVKPAPGQKGFAVLPRHWVVERTFAWLNNHRRLSKDYERETTTREALVQIAMMRLLLRRLCPKLFFKQFLKTFLRAFGDGHLGVR